MRIEDVINRIGRVGIESRNSTVREMSVSDQPPKKPAIAPRRTPNVSETMTTTNAMVSETRAPYRTRVNRSRPRWSTPSVWERPVLLIVPGGPGRVATAMSTASRGKGAMKGANSASTMMMMITTSETTASRWRRKRRMTTLNWLSCAPRGGSWRWPWSCRPCSQPWWS